MVEKSSTLLTLLVDDAEAIGATLGWSTASKVTNFGFKSSSEPFMITIAPLLPIVSLKKGTLISTRLGKVMKYCRISNNICTEKRQFKFAQRHISRSPPIIAFDIIRSSASDVIQEELNYVLND
uniref:Uncharacterized protein n=1 Tax=Romanomermis culicivorax TaxID=13658 RepID=A0A915LCJ2_ROMCU